MWDATTPLIAPAATLLVPILAGVVTAVSALGRQRHARMVLEAQKLQDSGAFTPDADHELAQLRAHHAAEYLLAAVPRNSRAAKGQRRSRWPSTLARAALIVAGLSLVGSLIWVAGTNPEGTLSNQWVPSWITLALVFLPMLSISVDRTRRRLERAEKYEELGGPFGEATKSGLVAKEDSAVLLWRIVAGVTFVTAALAWVDTGFGVAEFAILAIVSAVAGGMTNPGRVRATLAESSASGKSSR